MDSKGDFFHLTSMIQRSTVTAKTSKLFRKQTNKQTNKQNNKQTKRQFNTKLQQTNEQMITKQAKNKG